MSKLQFNPLSKQVTVGGHTFTVTALPLGVLRRVIAPMGDRFSTGGLSSGLDPELFDVMLKCTHQSVSKAEPDITIDDLENNLMMADMLALFQAVVEVSGLTRPREASLGEASSPLIRHHKGPMGNSGDGFTGMSLQPQDGHTVTLTES